MADSRFVNKDGTPVSEADANKTGGSLGGSSSDGFIGFLEDPTRGLRDAFSDTFSFFDDPFGTKAAQTRADQTIEDERLRLEFERFQALSKQRRDATQASLAAGAAKGVTSGKSATPQKAVGLQGQRVDKGGITAARKPAGQTLGDQGDFLGL